MLRRLEGLLTETAKEAAVTGADRLIAKGEAKGEAKALLLLLRARFPEEVSARVERRVRAGSVEQLDRWLERAVVAEAFSEIFTEEGTVG